MDDEPYFLNLADLRKKSAAQQWLVKGMIPSDAIGLLFGESGSYKTFVALDLALCVSHGCQWCGRKTLSGPVLFVAGEGGAGLLKRIDAWHKYHGLPIDDAGIRICPIPIYLDEEEVLEKVVDEISGLKIKPVLIVVDTFSQCFSGDENSNHDVSNFLSDLVSCLRSDIEMCTVLLLHHPGHSEKARMRGATALKGNVDFVHKLSKKDQKREAKLEAEKIKEAELHPPVSFEMLSVDLGVDDDGDNINSLVAIANGELPEGAKRSVSLKKYDRQVLAILERKPSGVVEGELKNVFKDEQNSLGQSIQNASLNKGFDRAIKKLEEVGLISRSNGYVRLVNNDQAD